MAMMRATPTVVMTSITMADQVRTPPAICAVGKRTTCRIECSSSQRKAVPELRERNGRQSRHPSGNPRVGPGQVYWNLQEISQARPRLLSLRVGCDPSFEGWGAWRIHAFCYFGRSVQCCRTVVCTSRRHRDLYMHTVKIKMHWLRH